jgi:Flp pilus assembly pilin Flp
MSSTDATTNRTSRPDGVALRALRALRDDDGAATAEYVIATMAAVGFAGLLVTILRGDAVKEILMGLVRTALSVAG